MVDDEMLLLSGPKGVDAHVDLGGCPRRQSADFDLQRNLQVCLAQLFVEQKYGVCWPRSLAVVFYYKLLVNHLQLVFKYQAILVLDFQERCAEILEVLPDILLYRLLLLLWLANLNAVVFG